MLFHVFIVLTVFYTVFIVSSVKFIDFALCMKCAIELKLVVVLLLL